MIRQTVARKLGIDVSALTRDPASGQQLPGIVPTLFVGIGGTGIQVLSRVKRRLRSSSPGDYDHASFLLIDTDPAALLAAAPLFGPQEFVGCPLPETLEGQFGPLPLRAKGHAAYLANFEGVDRALALAFRRLPTPDWRGTAEGPKLHPERTAIVLVASLWGLTGSGIILDAAYNLARLASQTYKAAYLFLPSAFDPLATQEDPSLAFANAYAALSEIHYLSTIDPATGKLGALWVSGPEGQPMNYSGIPWERSYLIEGANVENLAISYQENCGMVGDALFWDMTQVLGAWKWALRDRLGYAAGKTGGGPFASFGMASLRFPRERVLASCSRRFTVEHLERWVSSPTAVDNAQPLKGKPAKPEQELFLEENPQWRATGLVKRLSRLKGKGSLDAVLADWAEKLSDEADIKRQGRNIATILIKEWQRMDLLNFGPKLDPESFGSKIDANVRYRAEKYRKALAEIVRAKVDYASANWPGLQSVMTFLEDLGKRLFTYGPKFEEQLPRQKKLVAQRKQEAMEAAEELSRLCGNPITFPFAGPKVQAAAEAFLDAARSHLQLSVELRATLAAQRLSRMLVDECRASFERLHGMREVVRQAKALVRQREDPEAVTGDVLRQNALDDLFIRAFPDGGSAPQSGGIESPHQLASRRVCVELGCDALSALLDRIQAGEVLPGMLAEIAEEEGRRAFAPFASEVDFLDYYKRSYPEPQEQANGLAETYYRAGSYVRFAQDQATGGVLLGVNAQAFTEEGYKAMLPLLQAVPVREAEVGTVPLQEGEDEGVVYYREVAGLHITSLAAVSDAQPCYEWVVSQGLGGLHISLPADVTPSENFIES